MFFKLLILLLLQSGLDVLADAPQKPIFADEFCSRRSEGSYSLNCSQYYVLCNDKGAFLVKCILDLYFDKDTSQCIDKRDVRECRDLNEQALVLPTTSRNSISPYPIAFSCEGKIDGVYGQRCSRLFVFCQNELATFLRCPKGLIYDSKLARCLKKVPGCEEMPQPSFQSKHKYLEAFLCVKTANEVFTPVGEGYTVKCTEGKSILYRCPAIMILAPETMTCIPMPPIEKNPRRRSKRHVVYDLEDANSMEGQFDVLTGIITKVKSPQVYQRVCAGLPFGVHGIECSTRFVLALPDYCAIADCPPGHVFTNTLHHCVARTEVSGCSKVVDTVVIDVHSLELEQVADHSAVLGPVHVMTVATTAPIIPVKHSFDCANKVDQFYGWSCSSHYIKCVEDNPIHQICPDNLKFDVERRRCMEMKYVRGCSTIHEHENIVVKMTHAPLHDVPLKTHSARLCHGRDSIISVDCGRFTLCIDNVEYEFQCPANHYYDLKSGICVPQASFLNNYLDALSFIQTLYKDELKVLLFNFLAHLN